MVHVKIGNPFTGDDDEVYNGKEVLERKYGKEVLEREEVNAYM